MDALILAVAKVIDAGYPPAATATTPTVMLAFIGPVLSEIIIDRWHSLSVARPVNSLRVPGPGSFVSWPTAETASPVLLEHHTEPG